MAYNHERGTCYVLEKRGLCYIPIPKVASTTIRQELFGNNLIDRIRNFISDPTILQQHKTLCVVREPVDRFCSAYLEILTRAHDCPKTLEKDFFRIKEEPRRFVTFINTVIDEFFDAHVEPQLYYITDDTNTLVRLDEIWLIEEMNTKLQALVGTERQHHTSSKSNKKQLLDFLDKNKKVKRTIEKLYEQDIEFYQLQKGKR